MCEYESRCLNSDKCFRCFNMALLKLPKEKNVKYNSKKPKKNEKQPEKSWDELEQAIADKLNQGMEQARRSRMSGALWFEKGDVIDTLLAIECKERQGNDLQGGDKSISIKKSWLTKAKDEAFETGKTMVLPFRFKNDDKIYSIMEIDDIIELATMLKYYMEKDNNNAEVIKLLKERLEVKNKMEK